MAPTPCPVCNLQTPEAVCPRCATILVAGRATCPRCGKAFRGTIAVCACSANDARPESNPEAVRAIHTLAMVPGLGEDRARVLYQRGFHDFADIVRLGLPDAAVRRGLHHTISRQILLSTIAPVKKPEVGTTTCLACRATAPESEANCPACGAPLGADAEEAFIRGWAARSKPVPGELAENPDFRSMPGEVRAELLRAMETMLDEESVSDETFHRQIEAWRSKGFDVAPVLVLLAQHPSDVRERAIRLIRAQIRKKREGGTFKCPLCDAVLAPTAEACENCGARFA